MCTIFCLFLRCLRVLKLAFVTHFIVTAHRCTSINFFFSQMYLTTAIEKLCKNEGGGCVVEWSGDREHPNKNCKFARISMRQTMLLKSLYYDCKDSKLKLLFITCLSCFVNFVLFKIAFTTNTFQRLQLMKKKLKRNLIV